MIANDTVTLFNIGFSNNGTKISFDYSVDNNIRRFINPSDKLFVDYLSTDVREVPESLLVLPFVANMLPLSWFIGFDIRVNELDEAFWHSAERIKKTFTTHYPQINNKNSNLVFNKLVTNHTTGGHPAILFSGGVDSHVSLLRHRSEHPYLITIHGADIPTEDEHQFSRLKELVQSSSFTRGCEQFFIRSNLRSFYSYRVNFLFDDLDWWGRVQHGMSMVSLIAPLSHLFPIDRIYVAASSTEECKIFWGSAPQVDDEIQWGDLTVKHDSYDIHRAEKVALLVHEANRSQQQFDLKVCYSNRHAQLNCSHCEKCIRTIVLIILSGGDPNRFGFHTSAAVYDEVIHKLSKGFSSDVMQYVWMVVGRRIASATDPFIFSDGDKEKRKLSVIAQKIKENTNKGRVDTSSLTKFRYRLQLKYPQLFKLAIRLYRTIRST